MREMLKDAFRCNKCGAKHRVRTMRPQKLVRCVCGDVFLVTAKGYEFLNEIPGRHIVGQAVGVIDAWVDGDVSRCLLETA